MSTVPDIKNIRQNGNALKSSPSLYLRQHAFNPVNWKPWEEATHQQAVDENKPIFLSVGYSSCHWCHVMEKEVFEDDEVAQFLNQNFICIKVDREEKPDIDSIYMRAVQAMTGSGGWPMSVFLTPQLKPFFGGTYYPKHAFLNLVKQIFSLFKDQDDRIYAQAQHLYETISSQKMQHSDRDVSIEQIESVGEFASRIFDHKYGGFKAQMKFPMPNKWHFLLHLYRFKKNPELATIIQSTLDAIQYGGIHDHIGGGFHRYTVDPSWTVPHFEKMLYDNAQLASLFIEASAVFKREDYKKTGLSILEFLMKKMSDGKGFYASYDADSEGEEGVYYVWSLDEIMQHLGDNAQLLIDRYGISKYGNFEGKNVLKITTKLDELSKKHNLDKTEIERIITESGILLLEEREKRIPPTLDKKIVLSWNALTISSLVSGYKISGDVRYLDAAENTVKFILDEFKLSDDRFFRTLSEGKLSGDAVLDDYAFFANSLIDVFEVTGNPNYLEKTRDILDIISNKFGNEDGGFYFTHKDLPAPMGRQNEIFDNVEPSGFSVALKAFFRMGWLSFDESKVELVKENLRMVQDVMDRAKLDMSGSYDVALMEAIPYFSTVLVNGKGFQEIFGKMLQHLPFNMVIIPSVERTGSSKLLDIHDKVAINGLTTAYICEFGTCKQPDTGTNWMDEYLL
jgi:uncharacterized protein YyaL (SSP411 family)